jgi:hypothetical protein
MAAVSVSEVRAEHSVGFSHPVVLHVLSYHFPCSTGPVAPSPCDSCRNATLPPLLRLQANRRAARLQYWAGTGLDGECSTMMAGRVPPTQGSMRRERGISACPRNPLSRVPGGRLVGPLSLPGKFSQGHVGPFLAVGPPC